MAMKFAGFSPEQYQLLAQKLGAPPNAQQDELDLFFASSPGAAAKMGRYTEVARQMVEGKPVNMANGGFVFPRKAPTVNTNRLNQKDNPEYSESIVDMQAAQVAKMQNQFPLPEERERRFQTGGTATSDALNKAQQAYADALAAQQAAREAQAADPTDESLVTAVTNADARVVAANEAVSNASDAFKQVEMDTPAELIQKTQKDPKSLVTKSDVATTTDEQKTAGTMDPTAGDAGTAETAETTTGTTTEATSPTATPAAVADAIKSQTDVKEVTDATTAAEGTVSDEAQVDAATMDTSEAGTLDVEAAQIDEPTTVADTPDREVEDDELIEGSTVDMDRVKEETNFEAATGSPSTDATVKGQLTSLMKDFEGGDPPPWAAGAMRAATAAMAARGLGASSMAGQAIIQAAMESALPIAQIDASTFARFEEQNLSNKQQAAMFAAEKRAEFLGLEFNQDFQARVANAAKISEIANMNFTADQQVALENARIANSVDMANLNASNAKVLADAANLTQLDLANLNNRQQAQVQNAKSFLEMDMANLNNEQQTKLFNSQALINSIMSDAAAENAAEQFNASSENQTNQFFAGLTASISQFNAEQNNAMEKFNAGEANAIAEFNTTQLNLRDQFNTQNSLIIEQANAEWFQKIATTDNAAINQSNREEAAAANNMTAKGFDAYMMEVRDLMDYAWKTANNDADRAVKLSVAKLETEAAAANAKATKSSGLWSALGAVASQLVRPGGR